MSLKKIALYSFLLFTFCSCDDSTPKKKNTTVNVQKTDVTPKKKVEKKAEKKDSIFKLNTHNAIPFFFEYAKKHSENKVRIVTRFGNIDIRLYDNTPYHKANFIYLTRRDYFNGTCFHRVVKNFIIQGGSSDSYQTSIKRRKIGKYLLLPDVRKNHKHHRGVISMPSSEIDNPHQMASPYEFFIVQQSPGAYHLDGKYTAFGEVISGMDVVDAINAVETDARDWPLQNIIIKEVKIIK